MAEAYTITVNIPVELPEGNDKLPNVVIGRMIYFPTTELMIQPNVRVLGESNIGLEKPSFFYGERAVDIYREYTRQLGQGVVTVIDFPDEALDWLLLHPTEIPDVDIKQILFSYLFPHISQGHARAISLELNVDGLENVVANTLFIEDQRLMIRPIDIDHTPNSIGYTIETLTGEEAENAYASIEGKARNRNIVMVPNTFLEAAKGNREALSEQDIASIAESLIRPHTI